MTGEPIGDDELAMAPDDVLVQQWAVPAQADPFGRRVRQDGTVEECASAIASFTDGEWRFGQQTLEWRRVARLEGRALDEIRALARDLASARGDARAETAGTAQTWTVVLDGKRREVRTGAGDHAAIALDRALQLAIAEAG